MSTVMEEWQELADGVHQRSFESWNLNVGLVIGEERALVIDTRSTREEGRELREHVRHVTDRELVVVNTHAHLDHWWGNDAFCDAHLLAHPVAIDRMRSNPPTRTDEPQADSAADDRPESTPTIPGDAVSTSALVDLGGRSVAVTFHGRGHTGGDLVVEPLGTGVAFAGDLIRQDQASWYGDAYPLEWPATLTHMLLPRTATTWVPGHGLLMSDDEVRGQAAFIDDIAVTIARSWYDSVDPAGVARLLPLTAQNARHAATRGYRALEGRLNDDSTGG